RKTAPQAGAGKLSWTKGRAGEAPTVAQGGGKGNCPEWRRVLTPSNCTSKDPAMPPRRTAAAALAVSALIAIGVVAIGAVALNRPTNTSAEKVATPVAAAEPANAPARPAGGPAPQHAQVVPDFAAIAQQYGPAVVNITVTGTRRAGAAAIPGMPGGKGD